MNGVIWYNSVDLLFPVGLEYQKYVDRPGFGTYSQLFKYFPVNLSIVDRSNTVKWPVNVSIPESAQLPEYVKFTKSLNQICQETARSLLDRAKKTGKKLALLYSGGIDSSLMLISFLKIASASELKQDIVVLLNNYSIQENPELYYNYILKQCTIESSYSYTNYLGNLHYIVVSAEGNDQLQGSSLFLEKAGFNFKQILAPPDTDLFVSIFNKTINSSADSEKIINLFNKIASKAPVSLETAFEYYWWIMFVIKWQCVITRILANTTIAKRDNLKLYNNYVTFYQTKEHQLWSMNNADKRIQSTWQSYKYHCKEIIFDFDKNADYFKHKTKWGSGGRIMINKYYPLAFTDNFKFYDSSYPQNFWNDDNDFV